MLSLYQGKKQKRTVVWFYERISEVKNKADFEGVIGGILKEGWNGKWDVMVMKDCYEAAIKVLSNTE